MTSKFLEGKNIFLSALSKDNDLGEYADWVNDQDNTAHMEVGKYPSTRESLSAYIEKYNSSSHGILLGIFQKSNSKHIGNITLHLFDKRNRTAEIGIIIGDKGSRGKGYSVEAIGLVVEHAFNKLNFHKLYAGMTKDNIASKRAFEKVGFKLEGTLREHFYLNGNYIDCYRLGLLIDEYKK